MALSWLYPVINEGFLKLPQSARVSRTGMPRAYIEVILSSKPSKRRRFVYRRLCILLKREGVEMNWKKLYRLYKEERLTSFRLLG